MTTSVQRGNLSVSADLADFVETELLAVTGLKPDDFWSGFNEAVDRLVPKNRALLETRASMQAQIDAWLKDNARDGINEADHIAFLESIGYLIAEGDDFSIDTGNVDPEIASIAGPQLVVPITNARYALNAANARFGSLYDAFYGTDAIPSDGESGTGGYDPVRGDKVIARVRAFLDAAVPLDKASWANVTGLSVGSGQLVIDTKAGTAALVQASAFAGHDGGAATPSMIVLVHNNLHILIMIDRSGPIGSTDAAGINDVII